MSIEMTYKKENQGHPCRGCPYVFTRGGMDCIMAAVPGDCVWYFYRRMMERKDARISAGKKLEQGIRMLLEVAELKYGRRYAQRLWKKINWKGDAGKT